MITTILWDVDGTLLDFKYSQKRSLREAFKWAGREMTEEIHDRYDKINDDHWKMLELGQITKERLVTARFEVLFAEFGITDISVKEFHKEYERNLGRIYSFLEDSPKILEALQGRVHQYVITNGMASVQRTKLVLSGLADYMEELFISEEVGEPKPSPAFFDKVLEAVPEKNKENILVVGDSLTSDIKGGVLAGLKTCWYRREGTPNTSGYRPDYEIAHLKDVLAVLEG